MKEPQIKFPFASNEYARLKEIREVVGPARRADPFLQQVAERARKLLGSAAAMVSVVESDHQWFLARVGIEIDSTPRDYSICAHAIMSDDPMVLSDTWVHPEFANHTAVVQEPYVRFYVGAPIILSSGFRVGCVCGLDKEPFYPPSAGTIDLVVQLARETASYLESTYSERSSEQPNRRERALSDAHKEFLSLVGHEFRTPLTVVLGNALLLDSKVTTAAERRMLEAITASGRHLHNLIENVIRYSKLERGEQALTEETIVFSELLRAAAMPLEPVAQLSNREIIVSCTADVYAIRADGEQLSVALTSLIANALLHGEGAIKVLAHRCDDGTLRMAVYDHGVGLAKAHIDKADRPFTIGSHLNTRENGGLGLGLPIAKKIVELHGGWMQSGVENDKAQVEIRLPAWRCVPPLP